MEFYHLDYSLSIYMPEVNLQGEKVSTKEEIAQKIGMKEKDAEQQKPLLMTILEAYMSGQTGSAQPSY